MFLCFQSITHLCFSASNYLSFTLPQILFAYLCYCIYVANTICVFKIFLCLCICVFNVFSFSSPPLCHDANTIAGQQDSGLRHNHRLITNATKLSFSFVSEYQNNRKYSYCYSCSMRAHLLFEKCFIQTYIYNCDEFWGIFILFFIFLCQLVQTCPHPCFFSSDLNS